MAKQIIFLPKYTPGAWRCSRNGQANFAYTFGFFEGVFGRRKPPSRLFTKAVVLLNTLSGILDVLHQIAGLAIKNFAQTSKSFGIKAAGAIFNGSECTLTDQLLLSDAISGISFCF
jgi:hypothetical protein